MPQTKTAQNNFVTSLLNSLAQGAQGAVQGGINPMQQFMQSTGAPTHVKANSPISQAAVDLGNVVAAPIKDIAGIKRTPEEMASAQRGAETGMGMIQGQPESEALAPSVAAGTDLLVNGSKVALKAGKQAVKQGAQEIADIAQAQPGGLQAGFVKPSARIGSDLPPITNTYPYAKSPSALQKLGKGQDQATRQIRLPHGYAEDEKAANDTLNRLGFQGSGEQQYGQIQPKLTELNNWIQNNSSMATNPMPIKTSEVKAAFETNLEGAIRRGELTKKPAQKIRDSYLGQLHDNEAPVDFTENPNLTPQQNTLNQLSGQVPDSIPSPKLYQMKVLANKDATAIYRKLDNGGVATENDKVILAARNAFDQAIAKVHPDVKDATMDMSRIFDAKPSLEKARFNAPPQKDIVGAIIPPGLSNFTLPPIVKTGINKALTNPTALKVGGTAVALGATGLGAFQLGKNSNGQQDQSQNPVEGQIGNNETKHGQSVSNYYTNVKSDESGHYQLPTQGESTGTFMTAAQREAAEANLTPGTPEYQRIEQKFAQDQAMASKIATPEVSAFMKRAIPVQQNANNVYDALKGGQLPMNLVNRWDTWNDVQKYADPKYQTFATQLDGLNGGFNSLYKTVTGEAPSKNMLISPKDSQGQATAKLAFMTNFFAGTYGQYKDAYAATTSPSGQLSGTGQPQAAPMPQPQAPQDARAIMQSGALPPINLPPIQ